MYIFKFSTSRRLRRLQVGISEGSSHLPATITNRQDIRSTLDQTVGSIKYLLDEVGELRRKYQLNQLDSIEENSKVEVTSLRVSRSLGSISSFRSSFALRHRIRENQKQKSFLVIAKWALSDSQKFNEKVSKLKCLVDELENITRVAGLSNSQSTDSTTETHDNPPRYSAIEPLQKPPRYSTERVYQAPIPEAILLGNETCSEASLFVLSEYHHVMEKYLSVWPDESTTPRTRVRRKLHALTVVQFQELSQDVHDELLRRQRYEFDVPEWLPSNPSFHPKRNQARKQLSIIVHFSQLVSDIVFEFERRLRTFRDRVGLPSNPSFRFENISYHEDPRRWGICPSNPPPLLQYRAAHQSLHIDPASLVHVNRASVPLSTFYEPQAISSSRHPEPVRFSDPNNSNIWGCSEGRLWPLDRVISWLESNQFSDEWQKTFKALNICGAVFLELGNSTRGRAASGTMHLLVYPRLALECGTSGRGWDEAKERKEGKRLRRLIRRIPFPTPGPENEQFIAPTASPSHASVEIFRSFRVSMEDRTYKVLPAVIRKYNINAAWEDYALYVVYGDQERCLRMEEKPLVLFKQLKTEGKNPMFILRKIASSNAAAAQTLLRELPGGIV
jgi:hypothetical protein